MTRVVEILSPNKCFLLFTIEVPSVESLMMGDILAATTTKKSTKITSVNNKSKIFINNSERILSTLYL